MSETRINEVLRSQVTGRAWDVAATALLVAYWLVLLGGLA